MRGGRGLAAAAVAVVLAACTGGSGPPGPPRSHSPSSAVSGGTGTGIGTAARCPDPPQYAEPRADRPRYSLGVHVDVARGILHGKMGVTFAPDLPTDHLVFRLWPNAPPQAAEGAHLTVGRIELQPEVVLSSRFADPTTLEVLLARPVAAGGSLTASMPFTLKLPGAVLDRLSHDGSTVLLGSFFPILPWVPGSGWALDPPTTTLAEASTAPVADFDVTIHLPKGLDVLATGDRDGPDHWTATAVRDFAIAIGDFKMGTNTLYIPDPVQVTVGVERRLLGFSPKALLERVDEELANIAFRYGPYPWKSFSLALVKPLGRSGIEYPNMVFEGFQGIDRVTTHELSHQWFYSLVGNDQARDPWLDEALATWSAAQVDGFLPFIHEQEVHGVAEDHVGSSMTFWDLHPDDYTVGVYFRGVQALDSLGSPALVDCALRLYVARDAYGIATPADLLDALDEVIPNAPGKLAAFGIHP